MPDYPNRNAKNGDRDLLITNERIHATTIRLLDDEKTPCVISLVEALGRARMVHLDLVQIASGDPPVCRILDAARYRFEKQKADREQSRKQRELMIETKEIQLRPVTDDNDIMIKARRARGFLDEGDKVKVVVRFKGRERSHREKGHAIVEQFLTELGDHKIERPMANEGEMILILAPVISKSDLVRQRTEAKAE